MTYKDISDRIKATIDQFYNVPSSAYIEEAQLFFIGGVLKTALHLLPFEDYNTIKKYIYETYGYDPGGCTDGQISMDDMEEQGQPEWKPGWTTRNTVGEYTREDIANNLWYLKGLCDLRVQSEKGEERDAWMEVEAPLQRAVNELFAYLNLEKFRKKYRHTDVYQTTPALEEANDRLRDHWFSLVGNDMEPYKWPAKVATISVEEWIQLYHDMMSFQDDFYDRRDNPDSYKIMMEMIDLFFTHFEEVKKCLMS